METFAVNTCMASPASAGTAASALQALRLYFLAGGVMPMNPGLYPLPAPGPATGSAVFVGQGTVVRSKISWYFS